MQNENKIEGLTLKKLRELKSLNRKEAGTLLGVSFKSIENGRTTLNRTKIDEILFAYEFSYSDFCLCRDGKIEQVKAKFGHKKAKVLQVLRSLKGLTQYKASHLCGYDKSAIGHIENGRIEIPKKRIHHIVDCYGFSMNDFNHHMNSDVFVTEIQADCIKIIKALGEEKLKAVLPSTFNI